MRAFDIYLFLSFYSFGFIWIYLNLGKAGWEQWRGADRNSSDRSSALSLSPSVILRETWHLSPSSSIHLSLVVSRVDRTLVCTHFTLIFIFAFLVLCHFRPFFLCHAAFLSFLLFSFSLVSLCFPVPITGLFDATILFSRLPILPSLLQASFPLETLGRHRSSPFGHFGAGLRRWVGSG